MGSNPPTNLRERMIARLAALVAAPLPGLDGQFLAARRALRHDPDDLFRLELSDGQWVLEWNQPPADLDRMARAALERYAEAALVARQASLQGRLGRPLGLSIAAQLLACPVDTVAGAIASGQLRGLDHGPAKDVTFVDLLAWGNDHPELIEGQVALDPVLVIG